MTRPVYYVAHPLRPTEAEIAACRVDGLDPEPAATALRANLARAQRWLRWLRRSFPEATFIAPWIAAVLGGEDDSDPAQREAGLVDCCAVVELCAGIVLCGGRVGSGGRREQKAARVTVDLTAFGKEPPDDGARPAFATWASTIGAIR